jgi:hypothetical protein
MGSVRFAVVYPPISNDDPLSQFNVTALLHLRRAGRNQFANRLSSHHER